MLTHKFLQSAQISPFLPDYATPEERLWLAVISQTVYDAAVEIRNAVRVSNMVGVVPYIFKVRIEEILQDVQDPWFQEICALVNFHPDYIKTKVEAMTKEHRFFELKFVLSKVYMKLARALIASHPEMAEELLRPVNKYVYWRRKMNLLKTGPLPRGGARKKLTA